MNKNRKINILGTSYKVLYKDYDKDKTFSERSLAGYCNEVNKIIVIGNIKTFNHDFETDEEIELYEKSCLRHEIIHAYLNESGLSDNSYGSKCWAKNEEMVDWLAIQLPKVFKTYKELNILD